MSATIGDLISNVTNDIDGSIRGVTYQLFETIRARTPIDTGWARKNWVCSVGAPASGQNGDGSAEQVLATIPQQAGSVVYFTNNVPYIQKLEYDQHSKQAPNGMVRVSVARFESLDAFKGLIKISIFGR